ncbi:hypothetical protein GGX14DRAFT_674779 [Mycena pura]|uniref:DUF1793-domain-containing protein n=1 Tax=Mycena pura TaxID=153505 RepID=A0AAD6V2I1_9AGAR|nr:hypothetical protein GGX14DRAFT_674779 [Mycena pura]
MWTGIFQLWISSLAAGLTPQTFFPPSVPLAVRSPTFNAWLDTHGGSNPMETWPMFWNGNHTLGWTGYIKVDGVAWHWLGDPGPGNASTWLSTTITPTRTILAIQAGPMQLNVTFLSPVEPSDWVRQSLPFSYVYVDGASTDGKTHSIQLYADISAEWISNSEETAIQWQSKQTANTVFHQITSSAPSSVFQDVAEDTIAFHAIALTQGSRQSVIGYDVTLRTQSGNVRTSDFKLPVFAHAVDLGTTDTVSSIAWAVGVVRDPILTYAGVDRHSYYWSQYATIDDAIDAFITDFPSARDRALQLDQKILQDAGRVSSNYADLVSLATRQTMAGVELTVSKNSAGEWNTSDVMAFMKDVGSSQRVNPTETIYAAMPALVYLNASIIGPLLEPLLQFQNSSQYGNPYAAPDLGTSYPAAPGNAGNNSMYGIENSGNMLILVLAHARSTGDGSLIARYYNLLKRWADYLTTNTLIPAEQQFPADTLDTNLGQNSGNITNLAVKGIIAVQAMSEISQIMGDAQQAQQYGSTAETLMQSWTNLASSSGEVLWNYGDTSSSGLMYNFMADKLLQLKLLPFTTESSGVFNAPAALPSFGFSLSSDPSSTFYTRSDWTLFSAAMANASARDLLIAGVHKRASLNSSIGAFSNVYNVQTGLGAAPLAYPNGFSSPAQGAMFSIISLNVPNKTVNVATPLQASGSGSGSGSSSATGQPSPLLHKKNKNTGAIVGGVISIVMVVLLAVGFLLHRRWKQRRDAAHLLVTPRGFHTPSFIAETQSVSLPMIADSRGTTPTPYPQHLPGSKAELFHLQTRPLTPISQPPMSQTPSTSGTTSSGAANLRTELEDLRREMAQLRAANQGAMQDPPPMYQ